VVGASFDTVAEQKSFVDTEEFPFTLISDTDRTMGAAYEVIRPADQGLDDYPLRITYLLSPDGMIAEVYDLNSSKDPLDEHAANLLADIARLK